MKSPKSIRRLSDLRQLTPEKSEERFGSTSGSVVVSSRAADPSPRAGPLHQPRRGKYRHLSLQDKTKWQAVLKLLNNFKFFDLANAPCSGEINSVHYAIVMAVLTYPTQTDGAIEQQDLDTAHHIARVIRHSVKSGRVKYLSSKLASPRIVSGNPGTAR